MKTLEERIAVMTAAKNGAVIETCQLNIYKKPMYPYYTECAVEQLVWDWWHWDYRVKEDQEEKAYKIKDTVEVRCTVCSKVQRIPLSKVH